MSELWDTKIKIFTLLFSDLVSFCSAILSHPLYFSYFVFFLPYILKIVSFIYPLFITTFLVLFAVLPGLAHDSFSTEFGQSWVGHLQIACRLQSKKEVENGGFGFLEDLEMYKVVFGPSMMGVEGNQVEVMEEKSGEIPLEGLQSGVSLEGDHNHNKCELITADKVRESSFLGAEMEEKRLKSFLKLLDQFERMSTGLDEKKVERRLKKETGKIGDKQMIYVSPLGNESQAAAEKINANNTTWRKERTPKVKAHAQRLNFNDEYTNEDGVESSPTIAGTYGSMRKEKEWRRTLACMLFEERHNVDGGEGMDSLWETYETDSTKSKSSKKNNGKMSGFEPDEDCGYEDEMEGNLCCLQAIKLSAGKMNLGVGKPNLVKFSKAVKGFGWLHRVSKNNKKVHNSGDRY
ncbi:hypothetical protein F511_04773 [Dorcoceras hygrometricum]|uniref:Uncharacterized protein n=1 Tax=Dorcoceras hygrometricum TaxID=472368 RepID=A0A2Z7B2H9_9LAMI|nr:hypothetical protein F511_04773 [Dorcoceras hygrometricum]